MTQTGKFILFAASFLPLLFKVPYLYQAWTTSPLDRYDWLFFLLAIGLSLFARRKFSNWKGAGSAAGWGWSFGALALAAIGWWRDIHAVWILGAVMLPGGVAQLLFGSTLAAGMIPLLGLALLGCPSSSYWLGHLVTATGLSWLPGIAIKAVAGLGLTLWWFAAARPVALRHVAYAMMFPLLAAIVWYTQYPPVFGVPLRINEELNRTGEWLGMEEILAEADQRFFRDCRELHRKRYFTDNAVVYLLALELGDDIHNLHPAALCLTGAGQTILANRERRIPTVYGDLAVNELVIEHDGTRALMYQWNSGPEWSSGNFPAFRTAWRPEDRWYSFQLSTPIVSDQNAAEKVLKLFLNLFLENASYD